MQVAVGARCETLLDLQIGGRLEMNYALADLSLASHMAFLLGSCQSSAP